MSIIIDERKCVACRKCLSVCPGNLIKSKGSGEAYIKYPKDCWGCTSCIKECNQGAIAFYLGADIGGRGSKLTVENQGDILRWKIEKNNKEVHFIEIDKKEANKY